MISLYIHIPFCAKKCDYCDFSSYAGRDGLIDAYFGALEKELDGVTGGFGSGFETAFIGGGTPSYVDSALIRKIASKITAEEFTIEANPGTLTAGKLNDYLESGINRLSLGVQSFDDTLLRNIGRIHDSKQAAEAVIMAKEAGFEDINIDLMYALPGQTMDMWKRTLETAVSLPLTHISAYSLIIEEGTPISRRFSGLDDDTVNSMQRLANRVLSENGFERYEISNYARGGHICRHNMRYWTRGDYMGVGSAAHSLVGGRRFSNPASLEEYLLGARRLNEEIITEEGAREERVMLGLRTVQGIDIESNSLDGGKIERLVEGSLARVSGGRLMLTERGMEVMDAVVLELI